MRAAYHELARGVDEVFYVFVEEFLYRVGLYLAHHAGNEYVNHVVAYLLQHCLVGCILVAVLGRDKVVVLRRYYDGVYAAGAVVVVILHGHLALCVGAQVCHHLSLAAYVGQHGEYLVGQRKGKRHVVRGFVGGVAEHDSLVACALLHGAAALHSAVDVGALLVYGVEHAARFGFELVLCFGVTDFAYRLAHDFVQIGISLCLYFTGNHHLSGGNQCFASYFRVGVVCEQLVKHGIRNLVGHLVGMTLGY